jgi:hypothetical protein
LLIAKKCGFWHQSWWADESFSRLSKHICEVVSAQNAIVVGEVEQLQNRPRQDAGTSPAELYEKILKKSNF